MPRKGSKIVERTERAGVGCKSEDNGDLIDILQYKVVDYFTHKEER